MLWAHQREAAAELERINQAAGGGICWGLRKWHSPVPLSVSIACGVETKGSWLIRNPLIKGKTSEFGETAIAGTCSQDVSVRLPGQPVCHLLSMPVHAPAPGAFPVPAFSLPACTRIPHSSGSLDLPAHQHFPLHIFWLSSLIVLQHLAWAFLHISSAYLVPE